MKTYRVRTGCEIAGRWRSAGEPIDLTKDQVRELAAPFGHVVVAVSEEEEVPDDKLNRNKRRHRRAPE